MVAPPYVAGPLRLSPFPALRIQPTRVGGVGIARALSRPAAEVRESLRTWEKKGWLRRDAAPALHLHEYTAAGLTIRGLVGAADLGTDTATSQDAAILPHEAVHPGQVADLAARMLDVGCQPAPILLMHRGGSRLRELLAHVREGPASDQFTDRAGQFHRLWTVSDTEVHRRIAHELADCRAVIADGHHRYAAYVRMRHQRPDLAGTTSGLAMLVDQDDTPLFLGAIHRVLHGVGLRDLPVLPGVIVQAHPGPQEAIATLAGDTLVATDGRDWRSIHLQHLHDQRPAVQALQEHLIPALRRTPTAIAYAHSVDAALRAIAGRRRLAILVPAPDYDAVEQAARRGHLLPEKATSFQPKPSVGLFIRSLHDG